MREKKTITFYFGIWLNHSIRRCIKPIFALSRKIDIFDVNEKKKRKTKIRNGFDPSINIATVNSQSKLLWNTSYSGDENVNKEMDKKKVCLCIMRLMQCCEGTLFCTSTKAIAKDTTHQLQIGRYIEWQCQIEKVQWIMWHMNKIKWML